MKANTHPIWYPESKVSCVCGNSFTTGSILPEIRVEICSSCHPFYTGTQKFVDTQGQVERFMQAREKSAVKIAARQQVLQNRAAKVTDVAKEKPTLKDLLLNARKQTASS